MASEDILRKRIDKALAHIKQMQPESGDPYILRIDKSHLFPGKELDRLQAHIAQVQPKIQVLNGHPDLRELTNQELAETILWCKLGNALDQEDIEAAAKYRRILNGDPDQLLHWRDTFAAQAAA